MGFMSGKVERQPVQLPTMNRGFTEFSQYMGGEALGSALGPLGQGSSNVSDMFKKAQSEKDWRLRKFYYTQAREAAAEYELNRFKNAYANLKVSNPYRDMENTFEDLTINQPRRNFERATFQQSQSNILNTIRRTSGSAGVFSIAQALVDQGKIANQASVAGIQQEIDANKLTSAKQQGELERLEASGANVEAIFKRDQLGKLMSMNQREMFYRMDEQLRIDEDASKAHNAMMSQIFGFAGGMMGVCA